MTVSNKKMIIKLCAVMLVIPLLLCSCKDKADLAAAKNDEDVDVVLITDYGTIDDNSYNQMAWSGLVRYAEETGISYDYYKPEGTDTDSIMAAIKQAVSDGAKLIICPGAMHEVPVYYAQKKFDDTSFILVDGTPHNEDNTESKIADNVSVVSFAEEEAGFLAGYAAVRDGYKGLGFIGGIPIPPVIRFGYGFVQGADYAAIEMGVNVHVRYTYSNTFSEDKSIEDLAGAWYDDDTEVIFSCGGSISKSVIHAAENHNGKVIGVDTDESAESETVITSAQKDISAAVYNGVKAYFDGSFPGGQQTTMTAKTNGICLPMDTSRFEKFDKEGYDTIYSHIVDGMIVPYNKTDNGTCAELSLVNTEVTYIEYDK